MRTTGDTRAGALAGAVRRKRRGGAVTGGRLAGLQLVACLLLAAPAHAELTYLWTVGNGPSGISTSRMPFDSLQSCLSALSSMRVSPSGDQDRYCSVAGQVVRAEPPPESRPAPRPPESGAARAPAGAPAPAPAPVPIPVPVLPAAAVKVPAVAPATPAPARAPAPVPVPAPQASVPAGAPAPRPAPVLPAAPVAVPVPPAVRPPAPQPAPAVPPSLPAAAQPVPAVPAAQSVQSVRPRPAAPAPARELPALLQVQPLTILADEASDDEGWEQAELPMQVSEQGHLALPAAAPAVPARPATAAAAVTMPEPDDDFDDDEPPAVRAPAPVREVLPGFSGGLGVPGGP